MRVRTKHIRNLYLGPSLHDNANTSNPATDWKGHPKLAGFRVARVGKECATPFQLQGRRRNGDSQLICGSPFT